MEDKVKVFIDSLNTGLPWEKKGDAFELRFNNSDEFSDACVKISNPSSVEEIDDLSDIDLEGAHFRWNGYGDDEEVYSIQADGNFIDDEYKIRVWLD